MSLLSRLMARWSLFYYRAALRQMPATHPDVPEVIGHINRLTIKLRRTA